MTHTESDPHKRVSSQDSNAPPEPSVHPMYRTATTHPKIRKDFIVLIPLPYSLEPCPGHPIVTPKIKESQQPHRLPAYHAETVPYAGPSPIMPHLETAPKICRLQVSCISKLQAYPARTRGTATARLTCTGHIDFEPVDLSTRVDVVIVRSLFLAKGFGSTQGLAKRVTRRFAFDSVAYLIALRTGFRRIDEFDVLVLIDRSPRILVARHEHLTVTGRRHGRTVASVIDDSLVIAFARLAAFEPVGTFIVGDTFLRNAFFGRGDACVLSSADLAFFGTICRTLAEMNGGFDLDGAEAVGIAESGTAFPTGRTSFAVGFETKSLAQFLFADQNAVVGIAVGIFKADIRLTKVDFCLANALGRLKAFPRTTPGITIR